jgi:23S rRNA pseudouridine1911/1915/1917 synthase
MGDSLRPTRNGGRRSFVASTAGRVDAVLSEHDSELTRAAVQRLIASGLVALNGTVVRKSARVEPGDEVGYEIPERSHEPRAVTFDLPVLYEDALAVVIDKPAGIAVHPAPGDDAATVADWFTQRYELDAAQFQVDHPGIVHRLDRDTSGILLLARTPAAQAAFSSCFEQRTAHKTYIALTAARPRKERAVIDAAHRTPSRRPHAYGGHTQRPGIPHSLRGRCERRRPQQLVVVNPRRAAPTRSGFTSRLSAPRSSATVSMAVAATAASSSTRGASIPHPEGGELEVTAPLPPIWWPGRSIDGARNRSLYLHRGAARTPNPGLI